MVNGLDDGYSTFSSSCIFDVIVPVPKLVADILIFVRIIINLKFLNRRPFIMFISIYWKPVASSKSDLELEITA